MKYLLTKKNDVNLGLCNEIFALNGFVTKSRAMSRKNQNCKIRYKNGSTEINSENGGKAPLVMMFFDLILKWILLFLLLYFAVNIPDFITILMKLIK